ncbi:MAG: FkbM family methyltransferase, partial [Roseibium sp.]
ANYSFHPSHRIVPAAVGPEDTLTLHAIRPEHWKRFTPTYSSDWPSYRAPTGVTSTDRNCVLRWVKKHLPDECDPENLVTELTVPSKRLTGFLECLGKEPVVDVLQVDAEGFDDEVIYACDIDLTEPKIIRFEHSHLPEERLARLKKHLSKQYDLIESKMDVVGIRRP